MPFKVGDQVRITGIPGYQQTGTITNIFTDPLDTIITVETLVGKVSCFPVEIQKV